MTYFGGFCCIFINPTCQDNNLAYLFDRYVKFRLEKTGGWETWQNNPRLLRI
jgi:hypothetical protein